jgi:hypothetical protein
VPPTELIEGRDWLGFAGIAPSQLIAISKEQQFAEKLHAYRRSWGSATRRANMLDAIGTACARMRLADKCPLRANGRSGNAAPCGHRSDGRPLRGKAI